MPLEVYARLVLNGAEAVPMLTVARALERGIAGEGFSVQTEDGGSAHVVIAEVVVGDFAPVSGKEAGPRSATSGVARQARRRR